ncbi:hypothetical protein FDO65_03015 [Nakamurella flava]|uniref:histidine kinase n=1 Tax=Nakamurella flava TaxID=2576308 RepID=A0A4U6QKQ4_9ACTN|nr:ATP-binding protein [Nakamurella flava]TKV60678.1 hypothetical protein FDO65_03015 [Nakamurella flava]
MGRQIAVFYTVAALTAAVLAAGAVLATRAVARDQALADAQRATERLRDVTVAPLLEQGLSGVRGRLDELQRSVALRTDEGYLTEVTVWGPDGTILFSDEPAVTGTRVDLPVEALAAIDAGAVYSAFEDHPEASPDEADSNGFVEVYVPMTVDGRTYAFEAYYDYDRVSDLATGLLLRLLPLVLVPLVLLQLIQVPIAGSLARRVRRQEAERSRLLEQALSSSEKERVRIAADLHDGPIQDLAGIGYAMGSFAPALPETQRALAERVLVTVHEAVDSLRRMMVDIYPPDLTRATLTEIVDGPAGPLRAAGVTVDVVDHGLPDVDPETVTVLYRVAREALQNVGAHAGADHVSVELSSLGTGTTSAARLTIADDGTGLPAGDLDRRAQGHLGLQLLRDRVVAAGGTLTVDSPSTGGTTIVATVPARLGEPLPRHRHRSSPRGR